MRCFVGIDSAVRFNVAFYGRDALSFGLCNKRNGLAVALARGDVNLTFTALIARVATVATVFSAIAERHVATRVPSTSTSPDTFAPLSSAPIASRSLSIESDTGEHFLPGPESVPGWPFGTLLPNTYKTWPLEERRVQNRVVRKSLTLLIKRRQQNHPLLPNVSHFCRQGFDSFCAAPKGAGPCARTANRISVGLSHRACTGGG